MKRLIQISDCHLFGEPSHEAHDNNPATSLQAVLSLLMQASPDMLIVTGDISGDDSPQSYRLFLSMLTDTLGDTPWYVIPGNHDGNPSFEASLDHKQLRAGSPVSLGNWEIHGIDTRFKGTLGHASASELDAVAKAMQTHPQHHHLLALHHHILPSDSWMDRHCLTNAKEVAQWIVQQPGLRAALHGHIHTHSHYDIADCAIMGVPSTCWQWAMQPDFGVDDTQPGYRELLLSDDGNWTTTIRRLS
ncbi:metallophosphoesterase family protein [Alteromonas sp. H39]|uniref:metallophosphoesterase family protein n=1 Tax=Alteromonas sp. H39 TaxID=3389876 RepID=UPI0039E1C155